MKQIYAFSRMPGYLLSIILAVTTLFNPLFLNGQTPGLIFNPSSTVIVLDPNGDHYTSPTTAGFTTSDLYPQSEIHYFKFPQPFSEPTGDLRRGSDCNATEIVFDANGTGAYVYFDGTNILFRFRMGAYSPGAFGFNVLIDIDQKFGNIGSYADPTYLPQTTGTNGNAGFEYEIAWEKNFRVAVYDVNNTGTTPVFLSSYIESTHTQASKALTTVCGDPDYFMDFYVPLSALSGGTGGNVTSTTQLRMVGTTSTSPAPAIGGTKSDINGINDDLYPVVEDAFTTIINSQPPFTLNDVGSGGSGTGTSCTSPPVVSEPISTNATSVSGTWTTGTSSTIATIYVYKGTNTLIGTVNNVATGSTWTLSSISPALSTGEKIYAKAQASGESMCLTSNIVTVSLCNASNIPATPALSCTTGSKGTGGTNLSTGWTVYVDNLTRGTSDNSATNPAGFPLTGNSPNITWTYSGGCSSGSPLASGSYKIYYKNNVTGCSSAPSYFCAPGTGQNALAGALGVPVITSPSPNVFTKATTSITGTTDANAKAFLYINGINVQTATASAGGVFSFTGLSLSAGQQLYIVVELNTGTVSTSKCANQTTLFTVTCFTSIPIITAGPGNFIAVGSLIKGTSGEDAGAIVTVYNASTNTSLGTATVLADGTWTSAVTAAAGTTYYAKQTFSTCGMSDASATVSTLASNSVCPVITNSPAITESTTVISGTISPVVANTTIRLYQDQIQIGATTTSSGTWSITISSGAPYYAVLYAGGQLSATSQTATNVESTCAASVTVACTPPAAPVIPVTSYTTCINTTISVGLSTSATGIAYTLRNNAGTTDLSTSVIGTGSAISLTSYPLTSSQTIRVYASKFGNYPCESYFTPVTVTVPYPVMNNPANQTLCNGVTTNAVNFSSSIPGATYSWINNNISIGLAVSGNGNIQPFTAINTGSTTQVATITVTPTASGCSGASTTFTITVYPTPAISVSTSAQTLCSGAAFTINATNPNAVAGAVFSWARTNNPQLSGMPLSGSSVPISGSLVSSNSGISQSTIFTITVSANGCSSQATSTVTIFDNTTPTIACPGNITVPANTGCSAINVNLGTPTTSDNCGVASVTNNAPTTFPVGSTTVTWTATDAGNNSATCTQTVTVTNSNPSAVNDSYSVVQNTVSVPTSVTGNVLINDSDPEGQTLTVTSWTSASSGTLTTSSGGIFTFIPAIGFTGDVTFNYTVGDPCSAYSTAMVTIHVISCTSPPTAPVIIREQ